ncbi:MAG: hypothetical protein M5U13_17040 [Thermoanaerobaculia bacterium]|nr:hypothetical protein [Thermoanaerobaculia bacterium]
METLTVGMQNLRLADFFFDGRDPQTDDLDRLRRGKSFLRSTLANHSFLSGGSSQGLEELNIELTRNTCLTLSRIKQLGQDDRKIQEALSLLEQRLDAAIHGELLREEERQLLGKFFEAIGQAIVSEEVNRSGVDDGEAAALPGE